MSYCGSPLIGSRTGGLTSYALSVLVLYLFNKFRVNLDHPFSVLRCFLFTYANFNWANYVLSLDGPIPIVNGRMALPNDSVPVGFNRFAELQAKVRAARESKPDVRGCDRPRSFGNFLMRLCNIQDPVDPQNNIGVSVSPQFLQLLAHALDSGSKHLESLVHMASAVPKNLLSSAARTPPRSSSNSVATESEVPSSRAELDGSGSSSPAIAFLRDFFSYSAAIYLSSTEVRADLKDHPLQLYDAAEAAEVRGSPLEMSLQSGLQSMWESLHTAQELASLNEVSHERFLKSAQRGGSKHETRPDPMPAVPEDAAVMGPVDEETEPAADHTMSSQEGDSRGRRRVKRRSRSRRRKNGRLSVGSEDPVSSEATSREDWDEDLDNSSTGTVVAPSAEAVMREATLRTESSIGLDDLPDLADIEAPGSKNSNAPPPQTLPSRPANDENRVPKAPIEFYSLSVLRSLSFDLFQYEKPDEADHRKSYTDSFFEARKAGIKRLAVGHMRSGNGSYINTSHLAEACGETSQGPASQPLPKTQQPPTPKRCAPEPSVEFASLLSDEKGRLCHRKLGACMVICSFFLFCLAALSYGLACTLLEKYVLINDYYSGAPINHVQFVPITVASPPAHIPTTTQWARAGEDVFLDGCSGVGWWRKDGESPLAVGPKLSFGPMNSSVEGEYECRAYSFGRRGALSRINLRLAIPPTIRSKPTYSDLAIGKPFLVSLAAEGIPTPKYQWYQNGLPLPEERSNKLHFAAVEPRHSGTYSCLIQNPAGSVIWLEATLSVHEEV